MNDGMFIETFNGVTILVTSRGKFVAKIGDREIERTSLTAMKSEIRSSLNPIKALYLGRFDKQLYEVTLLKVRGKTIAGAKTTYDSYSVLVPYDENLKAELKAILDERQKLDNKWERIVSKQKKITAKNFHEFAKQKDGSNG